MRKRRYGPVRNRGVYVHPSRGGFTQADLERRRRAEAVKELLAALAPLPYATRLCIQQEVSRSAPADFWKARSRAYRLIWAATNLGGETAGGDAVTEHSAQSPGG
jgi:hypothetical protein